MIKLFKFLITLGGAVMAATTGKYSPNIQFYIDFSAQKIYNKERTIDQIFKKLQPDVLEVCKTDYNCDGYANPLTQTGNPPAA